MKVLVPADGSRAGLAPIAHLEWLSRSGVPLEVLLVNVQPRFHQHIARFTSRAAREAWRAERSALALAQAIEALVAAQVRFAAIAEIGTPAERIAAVAEREGVDEIVIGVARHPLWLRLLDTSLVRGVMARTDIAVTVLAVPPAAAERLEERDRVGVAIRPRLHGSEQHYG
jgi:nucleotide-binding universal stress UspA family protein